jgi:hypothetical protein
LACGGLRRCLSAGEAVPNTAHIARLASSSAPLRASELSQVERTELKALLSGGKHASRKLKRAQILLAADAGAGDEEIARSVSVGGSTVYRTKRRFVECNLERALSEEPRPEAERNSRARKKPCWWRPPCAPKGPCPLDAQAAGRCDSQTHRTQHLSRERVRRGLRKMTSNPGAKTCGAFRRSIACYVLWEPEAGDCLRRPGGRRAINASVDSRFRFGISILATNDGLGRIDGSVEGVTKISRKRWTFTSDALASI